MPGKGARVNLLRLVTVMFGSFNPDYLERYAQLAAERVGVDFTEEGTYDFTRCVRPDGSVYGTSGKCRKGTETGEREEVKKEAKNNDVTDLKEGFKKFFKENPDALDENFTTTMFNYYGDDDLQDKLDAYLVKEFKNNVSQEEKKKFVEIAKEYAKDKEKFLEDEDKVMDVYERVVMVQDKMLNKLGPVGKKMAGGFYHGQDEFPLGYRYGVSKDDVRDDYNYGRFGDQSVLEEPPSPQDILKLLR